MLSPLAIQRIIDQNITGVEKPWVEVTTMGEKTVKLGDRLFEQNNNGNYNLVVKNNEYYFVHNSLKENDYLNKEEVVKNNKVIASKIKSNIINNLYGSSKNTLGLNLSILLLVSFGSIIFSYVQKLLGAFFTVFVTRDARLNAMKAFQYIDLNIIEGEPVGKTANKIINDSVALAEMYTISIGLIFNSMLQIVFSLIGMFYLSPTLAVGALFLVPIIIVWVKLFSTKINKIANDKTEKNSLMVGKINEIINGITVLKIFNSSKKTLNDF